MYIDCAGIIQEVEASHLFAQELPVLLVLMLSALIAIGTKFIGIKC